MQMQLSRILPMPAAKVCTERRLEARKDDQVQQRCDPAEKQVGQTLIVFLDDVFEFLHDVPVLRL